MTPGVVVWFTGLPASGKSTLASRVRDRMAPRTSCVMLDSDRMRAVLGEHGYGPEDRDAFYMTLGKLAAMLAYQGQVVLVAATAPRRVHREQARALAPSFIEVHVDAPLADCEARDIKGLYAQARTGAAPQLPGLGAAYEPPRAPDIVATGGLDEEAEDAIDRLITARMLGPWSTARRARGR